MASRTMPAGRTNLNSGRRAARYAAGGVGGPAKSGATVNTHISSQSRRDGSTGTVVAVFLGHPPGPAPLAAAAASSCCGRGGVRVG
jgi:hypothetical protein